MSYSLVLIDHAIDQYNIGIVLITDVKLVRSFIKNELLLFCAHQSMVLLLLLLWWRCNLPPPNLPPLDSATTLYHRYDLGTRYELDLPRCIISSIPCKFCLSYLWSLLLHWVTYMMIYICQCRMLGFDQREVVQSNYNLPNTSWRGYLRKRNTTYLWPKF